MKKYWKSISIVVMAMVTVGFFYIQSALAGSDYPEFEFENVSGDESEVENLILYGDYRENHIRGDNFQMTAEGTQYQGELSYFDRLHRGQRNPEMKRLQNEFKSFMRGKNSMSRLAENEEHLAYANINSDMELEIEVLDKISKETTEFTGSVSEEEKYSFIYVDRVHINGNKVSVITSNYLNGTQGAASAEIYIHEFDIEEKNLANEEMIISYSDGGVDQTSTSVYMSGNRSTLQSNSHAIFIMEQWESGVDEEGMHFSNLAESKVISIDMETNEHAEFELPDDFQNIIHMALLDDSRLYFTNPAENGLKINVYDLEKQEMKENRSFTIEQETINRDMGSPLTAIKGGKMYIVSYSNEEYALASIFVADVQSGELVYEGKIRGGNGDTDSIAPSFHVFDMAVR